MPSRNLRTNNPADLGELMLLGATVLIALLWIVAVIGIGLLVVVQWLRIPAG